MIQGNFGRKKKPFFLLQRIEMWGRRVLIKTASFVLERTLLGFSVTSVFPGGFF